MKPRILCQQFKRAQSSIKPYSYLMDHTQVGLALLTPYCCQARVTRKKRR